jgi:hypothetical protein
MCGAFAWTSVSGAQAVPIVVIVVNRNAQKTEMRRKMAVHRADDQACALRPAIPLPVRWRVPAGQELVAAAPVVEPVALAELGLAGESLDRAFHLAFCAAINSR